MAQTIFTTPNMTLNRATSLFETYHPGSSSSTSVVKALFCRYCKKDGHDVRSCNKKKSKNQKKKHTRPDTRNQASSAPLKKKQRYPCAICDSMTHLSHKCPRREDVKKCLQTGGSGGKLHWGADEQISDDDDKWLLAQRQKSTVAVLTTEPLVLSLSPTPTLVLDSGAYVSVVQSNISSHLHNIHPTCAQVATAEEGHSLQISGEGELGPPSNNSLQKKTAWMQKNGINTCFLKINKLNYFVCERETIFPNNLFTIYSSILLQYTLDIHQVRSNWVLLYLK